MKVKVVKPTAEKRKVLAGIPGSLSVAGKLSVEAYFLKYAFPCAFITLQRGAIDAKTYDRLERAAVRGESLTRRELEKVFAAANRRMDILVREHGYKKWSFELVRDYYWKWHERFIKDGEGSYKFAPKILKDLCRVLQGTVVRGGKDTVVVRLKGRKTRPVMTELTGPLKKGDKVMVHYGYACEKL
jgi:hypothetical protein